MTEKTVRLIADSRFINSDGKLVLRNGEFTTTEENAKDMISMGLAHPKPTTMQRAASFARAADKAGS